MVNHEKRVLYVWMKDLGPKFEMLREQFDQFNANKCITDLTHAISKEVRPFI